MATRYSSPVGKVVVMWEFLECLADPEDWAVKIEKDGSISLRAIYDLEQDGYHPRGASRFAKSQPKILDAYQDTLTAIAADRRQGISANDEHVRGEV